MKLYRVMSRDEWDDLRRCGFFRCLPGQMEGKWFATTMVDALVFGRRFPGTSTVYYHVVEIDIDLQVLATATMIPDLDTIGDAYYLTEEHWNGVKFRLVNPPPNP